MNSLVRKAISLFYIPMILASCGENQEERPPALEVSVTEIAVESNGGTFVLDVQANQPWNSISTAAWVQLNPSSGEGDGQLAIVVDTNTSEASRTMDIRVTGGGIVRTVKVTQAASEPKLPTYHIPSDQTGMRDIANLQLAAEMGVGWNVGNSLEAIGGETAWGNPMITKELIDEIKAAGFNSVRIPVAWSKFSDAQNYTIDAAWMSRVQEVVDYVIDNGMYAVLNQHWDEGWMQPTYGQQDYVNDRLEKMWIQIALHFRDYDDHLLFAGTNEVMVTNDYGTPTVEYYTVQNSFNQTFVDAVRSTGGRNAYRNLVVQTFNTNIDHGISFLTLPEDTTEGRLMVEVHY